VGDAGFGLGGDGAEKRGAIGRDGEEEDVVFTTVESELEGIEWEWACVSGRLGFSTRKAKCRSLATLGMTVNCGVSFLRADGMRVAVCNRVLEFAQGGFA